ncbi:MAG: Clp1/GlmU family protein [Planctomycetota bacterium]|jgi:polynucleotide 5'-hydroxyl-kinase GRC3/NOL9
MLQDWAEQTAQRLLSRDLISAGICLILGGADTGKTTLTAAIAKHAGSTQPVGIIDADIGQSHIGPPTSVGWAIVDRPQVDFSQLGIGGISFVGDITPAGHLLQLTAAIVQCFQQISKLTKLIIIDTPGFICGPTAAALWWTVQRILQPESILAVQHNDELSDILGGLRSVAHKFEQIRCPLQIPTKSPHERRRYRQNQFSKYFRDSCLYNISLSEIAVQRSRDLTSNNLINRLVALRDGEGVDIAIGQIRDWQYDKGVALVGAPPIDIRQIRCLVIGEATIEVDDG